jgi:hypothetical protein
VPLAQCDVRRVHAQVSAQSIIKQQQIDMSAGAPESLEAASSHEQKFPIPFSIGCSENRNRYRAQPALIHTTRRERKWETGNFFLSHFILWLPL